MSQTDPFIREIRPGRAYRLRLALAPATAPGAATLTLTFHDSDGAEVDERLSLSPAPATTQPRIEHLPAAVAPEDRRATRFFVAPPDAVRLRIDPAEGAALDAVELDVATDLVAPDGADGARALRVAGRARRARIEQALGEPLPADVGELIDGVAARQWRGLRARSAPNGDWDPVIAALDDPADGAAHAERLARLAAARDRDPVIAFIGSGRTYHRLQSLGRVFWLKEHSFAAQLELADPDLVLVETFPESHHGGWDWAFSSLTGDLPEAGQALVDALRARGIRLHLLLSEAGAGQGRYDGMIAAADRVIATPGTADVAGETEIAIIARAGDPTLCMPATETDRPRDLMLVPVGSDLMSDPAFLDLVKAPALMAPLVTEFHYAFEARALAPRLAPCDIPLLPRLTPRQRLFVLRYATMALFAGRTLRAAPDLLDALIDTIMAGTIPVIFGENEGGPGLRDAIPHVGSAQELIDLQGLLRISWYRERLWRRLFRQVEAHHRLTATDRAALLGEDVYPPAFDAPLVSVVLVSMRLHLIEDCLAKFRAQTWPEKELILVLNTDARDLALPELRANEEIHFLPARDSIGRGLNLGIQHARGAIWVKMDDDDLYSPHYLAETVAFFRATQADSVGRQTPYYYLDETGLSCARLDRFGRTLCRFTGTGAFSNGATLTGRKKGDLPAFSNFLRNSADTDWIDQLRGRKGRYYNYDSSSIVVYRDADESRHSWQMSTWPQALRRLKPMTPGNVLDRFERDS